jgi:hypothetical protein
MFRYKLRTLLILLAVGPPMLAAWWWFWPRTERLLSFVGPWEVLMVGLVLFILLGHHIPSLMRALARDFYL